MAEETPPQRIIFQQSPTSGQCTSHEMFERFLQQSLENLGNRLAELAEALTAQSKSNGEAIHKVLANQADRRELCGQQNARLDAAERDIRDLRATMTKASEEYWKAINDLREKNSEMQKKLYQYIGMGTGAALVVSFLGQLLVKAWWH